MKSNKGYIFDVIVLQIVVIPIILTGFAIFLPDILTKLFKIFSASSNQNSGVKLIYILIAFFGSLLVGGIMGFVYSRLSKREPTSSGVRYGAPMAVIIYAFTFAAIALIFSKGNYNSGWWGIYILKNPFFLIFDAGLALSGLPFIIPVAEISAYSGFFVGILAQELISKSVIRGRRAVSLRSAFVLLFAIFTAVSWVNLKDIIGEGILELRYGQSTVGNDLTEFDLFKIAPFKDNNGLVKLEGRASLQFTELDKMPRLDGATAAYPVYAAFVQAVYKSLGDFYEANKASAEKNMLNAFVSSDEPPYNIVKCSKTAEAYENLMNKTTDIIFVAEPSKAQIEEIKAKGDEFVLTPIGNEAFMFFTNKKNPVDELTIKQIQDIYSGKIVNWREVGGRNKEILPYQRPEDSGSQTIMENKVMKDIKMLEPTKETHATGMGEVINKVAGYKNAENSIGYSFMYYSSSMIKSNQIKYIAVNGIKPTAETVRSREYPFTVPVYAVTLKSNSNKNITKFIEWILSTEGQSIVEKTGYVPVK